MSSLPVRNRRLRITLFCMAAVAIYLGNARLVVPSELTPGLIAFSVAIDLVAWVPLLYYLILQRCGAGPAFVTRLLVTAGIFSTFALLPDNSVVAMVRSFYPAIVGFAAAVVMVFFSVRLVSAWPEAAGMRGEDRIGLLTSRLFGDSTFASILRAEWTCVYYALWGWRYASIADQRTRFSYHEKSGAVGTLIGMSVLHVPGLFFWHLIVHHAWPAVALAFTGLHAYTMLFTFGQAMAMRHRFIALSDTHLTVRFGMLFNQSVPIDAIERVERATWKDLERAPGRLGATFAGMANVKIVFRQPQKIAIMAGISKPCTELILGVDAPMHLIQALAARLTRDKCLQEIGGSNRR